MSLTWKDGLATVFVGAAALLYLSSQGGATVAGMSGTRALSVAIFALGNRGVLHGQVADGRGVWRRP